MVFSDSVRSRTTATVSRRLLKWQDEGPHSYRILAKPLSAVQDSSLQRFLAAQRLDVQQRYEEIFNEETNDRLRQWQNLKRQPLSLSQKSHEKFIFEEELEAFKKLRYESKATRLLETVFKGITVRHEIQPSLGEQVFFEFPLENTFAEPISCVIEMDDPALRVIFSVDEWEFNKKAHKLQTPMEKGMFRQVGNQIEVYLKPRETIFVPFLYNAFKNSNEHELFATKVIFRRWDSKEPFSILDLHVRNRSHCLQHSFVFVGEARTNFERAVQVPSLPGNRRVASVRCNDPSVKASHRNVGLHQILNVSAYSGDPGEQHTFLVFLYSDMYESR
ncbi:unnamed protein product [Caenorhabditis auriculariae]|uniref:NPHP4 Ig-like domain-containing protein n=1 Tax=Caenorhabditis auriculariae TaxID=2777116 RepID=A0A8S1GUL9_9PELO|nr:unnamed protein product [Caenorhabditis auriculariae]